MQKKFYCGIKKSNAKNDWDVTVTAGDKILENIDPNKRRFTWGYAGGGPLNLAQSLLADYIRRRAPQDPAIVNPYTSDLIASAGQYFAEKSINKLSCSEGWHMSEEYVGGMLKWYKWNLRLRSWSLLKRWNNLSPFFKSL